MAKPTMLQSLLGRPSQKYSFPQEKVYYSTKRDMLRIATENVAHVPLQPAHMNDNAKSLTIKPTNDVGAVADRRSELLIADEDEDDDDSDYDVFYTPNTSPRTSMASTISPPLKPPSPTAVTSTKTSLTHVNTSTTSISSSALDAHSLFSFVSSESTVMTSLAQSDSEQPVNHSKMTPEPPQVANGHADQEWAKDVRWLVPTNAKATITPRKQRAGKAETPAKPQTRTKPTTPMSKSMSKTTPSIMSSMAALLEEEELICTPEMLHHPRSSVLISTPRRSRPRNRLSSDPAPSSSTSSRRTNSPPDGNVRHRRSRSFGHASTTASPHHATSSRTSSPHRNSKYASSSVDPYDRNLTSLPSFNHGDLPSHGTPGYTSLVLPRAPVPLSQTSHQSKGLFSPKETLIGISVDGKVDLTRSGVAQTTMASVEVVRGLSSSLSPSSSTSPGQKLIGLFRRGSSFSPQPSSGASSAFGSSQSKSARSSEDGKGKKKEILVETPDSPLGFTSYRAPPKHVPSGSVLVQVWAASLDGVDRRLVLGGGSGSESIASPNLAHAAAPAEPRTSLGTPPSTPKRSASLRSTLGRFGNSQSRSVPSSPSSNSTSGAKSPSIPSSVSCTPAANVGYIPGRGFVGRILECGWEVEEETKRGDWVVGLLDLKKAGALTEFIVVDRHRVHRVPHPRMQQNELSLLQSTQFSAELAGDQPISSGTHSDTIAGTPSSSRSSPSSSPSPSRTNSVRTVTSKAYRPSPLSLGSSAKPKRHQSSPSNSKIPMSLEELALLPLCGIPAYRAVRTFAFAFSDAKPGGPSDNGHDSSPVNTHLRAKSWGKEAFDGARQRRVLVLRGHDGAGAIAMQMLVRRGWRVCVHVPSGCLPYEDTAILDEENDEGQDERTKDMRNEYRMRRVEERVRGWGGEEIVFDDGEEGEGIDDRGAVVRVIDRLCEDGDVFDAVLDTVGGKEVREASERLLRSIGGAGVGSGNGNGRKEKAKKIGIGIKQFTTLVGDTPERTIPSASDNFKAGLRSLNFGAGGSGGSSNGKKVEGKVGYAWVSYAQDVDWEGEGIRETLGAVLRNLLEDGIRPWVGGDEDGNKGTNDRVVPFEKAPQVLVNSDRSLLMGGGTVVVKIVG